jgi:hypothetical protein
MTARSGGMLCSMGAWSLDWTGAAVTGWVVAICVLLSGAAVVVALLEERSETGAHTVHAHADGTVHEHFLGARAHVHPTLLERYDELIDRTLGSRAIGLPIRRDPDRDRPLDPDP